MLWMKLMLLPWLVVLNLFSLDLKALVASWMCDSHVLLSLLDPAWSKKKEIRKSDGEIN